MQHSTTRPGRVRTAVRPWSVRAHLWGALLVAVVLVAGSLALGYTWSVDRAERRAVDAMAAEARVAADEILGALRVGTKQVTGVAGAPELTDRLATGDCTLVLGGSEAFPDARLDIVGPQGQVGCSSQASLADVATDVHGGAEWFDAAMTSPGPSTTWPATDPVTGRPVVLVTHAFAGPDGAPAGLVALFLDAGRAAPALAATQALPPEAALTVVGLADRSVVSTSTPAGGGPTARMVDRRASGRWVGPDGVERQHASAVVGALGWRVYAGLEHASVVETAQGTLVRQALAGTVAMLALALALWLVDRRVAGPLGTLTRSAVRARDGAGNARVPERGTAELVELARALNTMLDVRAGQEVRLAYQATHDRLTGLPDAEWARGRLEELLEGSDDRPGCAGRVGVLQVGLDRFGTIATGIGPEAADRVLVEVAARCRPLLRPGLVLARAGSEGFLVVCDDVGVDEAIDLAEQLRRAVQAPMGWPAPGLVVHVSTGIDLGARGHRNAGSLLRGAATALAHAQERGRVWSVFDDSMRLRATQQLDTEHRLREALARDELVVHYQPVVQLGTGRITGAEALVRWHDPERGLVPPLQFIPVAEESGQIAAIGELVLTRACRQAARWSRPDRPFVVSVNVAGTQLLDDGFAGLVAGVLRETGLSPAHLCLEVTESTVVRRAGSGVENLHRLRRLGVHVAVDDFGTGYSSLSYLQHLPISALKIDRSFITRIEHEQRDRHLVEAVLGMARALDLTVVAEGVETTGQRDLLVALGCESAQGYLFGRPCHPDELGALLDRSPVG